MLSVALMDVLMVRSSAGESLPTHPRDVGVLLFKYFGHLKKKIRLLNPEPAIGCAPAAIVGWFIAITHRKQSLADLMTVFGCRGRRQMTATGDGKGLNSNGMIPSGCRLIIQRSHFMALPTMKKKILFGCLLPTMNKVCLFFFFNNHFFFAMQVSQKQQKQRLRHLSIFRN